MSKLFKNISVLDCTLRDGSYLIDYQFTAEDTYLIALGLARAGFEWIEVGYGTGLGSSRLVKREFAATDKEYIQAAKKALFGTTAKIGMFFIPGIGTMEDLLMAHRLGVQFVRIGTNVTEIDQAKPFIEKAKSLGMTVCSNLMKSYAVSIKEFVSLAKKADCFGADVITVVDSAGGMFPEDVRVYVGGLRQATNKRIGFHGHNNLQLAIANTLEAIKEGADMVDSSLQGIGRSAGNTQTEVLVMVLHKIGYKTGVDIYKTLDLGEKVIKPMVTKWQGVDDVSLVSGVAQFHSSFLNIIYDVAKKYNIDPRKLILEVSGKNRVNVSFELAEKVAKKIQWKRKSELVTQKYVKTKLASDKKFDNILAQAESIAHEINSQSKKTGKESVFSITLSPSRKTSFPYIRQSSSLVISNVELADLKESKSLVEKLDGLVDWLLFDESSERLRESRVFENVKKSRWAWYSEKRVLYFSILALLSQMRPKKNALILADKEDIQLMEISLNQQGIEVVDTKDKKKEYRDFGVIISFGKEYTKGLTKEMAENISMDVSIFAARPGAFPDDFWKTVVRKGHRISRIDLRAALACELSLAIETKKTIGLIGTKEISGVRVISGGYIGPRGSIVVDSFTHPTRVIGIGDGYGGLLDGQEDIDFIKQKEKLQKIFIENLYKKEY